MTLPPLRPSPDRDTPLPAWLFAVAILGAIAALCGAVLMRAWP